jgi:hypothetical protein
VLLASVTSVVSSRVSRSRGIWLQVKLHVYTCTDIITKTLVMSK